MKDEQKLAYWDLLARHLESEGQGRGENNPPTLFWILTHWHTFRQGLLLMQAIEDCRRQYARELQVLAVAARHDFEDFDPDAFWAQPYMRLKRSSFDHFVARAERKTETGEWMPKPCRSVSEITLWLERGIPMPDFATMARIEEAIHQLSDFPVEDSCVAAALKLLEYYIELKMYDCDWPVILRLHKILRDPRYSESIKRYHKQTPSSITSNLLFHDEQKDSIRVKVFWEDYFPEQN